MKLVILQPDTSSIDIEDVGSININSIDGQVTILPNHASLITALDVGIVNIKSSSSNSNFVIHGGFLEIYDNKVVILADACETFQSINRDRAGESKNRAQKRILGDAIENEIIDISRAKSSLKRADLRIKASAIDVK
jgi:F-type H+-transporting ATPase subunit epsilon